MENTLHQRTAWSAFSWTRWGFVLVFVGIVTALEVWMEWHRTQYLPSSYFLPEFGWHSTVPWADSWPTVVGEAACYVQLGWFWVGLTMVPRQRMRWADWCALMGSLVVDVAIVLVLLALAVWGRQLATSGGASPPLAAMTRHLERWLVDIMAVGMIGAGFLLLGQGVAPLLRASSVRQRMVIGLAWVLGIALTARLDHNGWVPILYSQMKQAGILPPHAPSAFVPFVSLSAPVELMGCLVVVALLGWWLLTPPSKGDGLRPWPGRRVLGFVLGAWGVLTVGFWWHLRPSYLYAAHHGGVSGSGVALSMVDAVLMLVPTLFLVGLFGPSAAQRKPRIHALTAVAIRFGAGLVILGVLSGVLTDLALGHWPYGSEGQQAAWIGAVYGLAAVESLAVAAFGLGLIVQPVIAPYRRVWQRCCGAGLGFAVALLLVPALQWWWFPFFTQVDRVTGISDLGGPDVVAVPVATLLKYVGSALLVAAVLVLAPSGPDQTDAEPMAARSTDGTP